MAESLRDALAARLAASQQQDPLGVQGQRPAPTVPVPAQQPTDIAPIAVSTFRPHKVTSIDEMGLSSGLLHELVLKALYVRGQTTPNELCEWLKLPFYGVLEALLRDLSNQELCYITSGQGMNPLTYSYTITTQGQARAQEVAKRSDYVGPAPVSVEDYWAAVHAQSLEGVVVHEADLRRAFASLIVDDDLFDQLGPAANSARAMFLFGQPGNGKTAIAETLVRLLGGEIYIPYAIEVNGEVVRVFDPVHHPLAAAQTDDDPRWVHAKRPVVSVGGELTLPMLDLIYNELSRYYEAPFQLKANNGAFFIDDFGRQQVSPRDLLNRWIVPLEKRVDFLTLRTGQKMEVPFDTLVIFSTNLDPKELVDEAFLRRIRYKIEIKSPSEKVYKQIFQRVCAAKGIEYDEEAVDYLLQVKYPELGVEQRAVHPRDLIEQVVDYCQYRQIPPKLTHELLDIACTNYFVAL